MSLPSPGSSSTLAPGPCDGWGIAISVEHAASEAAVQDFGWGLLEYTPRLLNIVGAAQHDDSVVVQTLAAALHLLGESPQGWAEAQSHLQRAAASTVPALQREYLLLAAVQAWHGQDMPRAMALHEQLAREYPRDLVAAKIAQYHCFNLGDSAGLLRFGLAAHAAAADVPQVFGMLAFGYEQCHWMQHAEQAARRGLALAPQDPWAQHALAHVLLTQGRFDEGAAFLQSASGGWSGLTSFMATHNHWHLALFEIELGHGDAALARYDTQVWGVDKRMPQDQVGAVSLLARLELAGMEIADRWQELASYLASRVDDVVLPFLSLQYLYGLARAERPEADALMARMEAHAPAAPAGVQRAWAEVAVPAGRALVAYARGDCRVAADALGAALPRMGEIGGSHAQRDLFEQLYVDALRRAGRLREAQQLLQPRLNASPASVRLQHLVTCVNLDLGLPIPH